MASGKNPANKKIVAAKTSGTPEGGVGQDLAVYISFLSNVDNEAIAFSTKG